MLFPFYHSVTKNVNREIIAALRNKDDMSQIFEAIAKATPSAKAKLKTLYGLEDCIPPLLKLSFDVYK